MKNEVTYTSIGNSVHIFINEVLHIGFEAEDLKGIQSWKMGRVTGRYCIELYFVSDFTKWEMKLEYDNIELAKEINNILQKFI